ncbi:Uncharacterised protein [Cedecea lapagei]|uniref:Uncharacterized protein n=1 Tax=Cedecea lapagei TaxID=158823 RepID=A0A447V2G0_9ENTR|nr:Uncharacterised protein [Cedecea lapagei]
MREVVQTLIANLNINAAIRAALQGVQQVVFAVQSMAINAQRQRSLFQRVDSTLAFTDLQEADEQAVRFIIQQGGRKCGSSEPSSPEG